jgi:poly(A) polymerase
LRIRYSTEKNGKPVKKAIVYTQDEHGINFSNVDTEAVHIVERLRFHGYETYIVGGAVRDLILGKKPKDFDIVSEAEPAQIKKLFYNARIIGHRFRLVHVCFGSKKFEVSTFRSLKDGLTSNTFGTIEEDVLRRDFSINALFYDPLTQVVVDYVRGMADIQNKRIRPLIPLSRIFIDDPVRMIRAVKYGTTTGFKLTFTLRWMIKKQASLLREVSPSRLTEEIFKIIHSSQAAEIVERLESLGLYAYLQPSASALLKGKKDFWKRYFQSLEALNRQNFKGLQGETLAGLIRDYLEEQNIPWNGDIENYKNTFITARQFIQPMNPPRTELDMALRLIFKEHGIVIKKSRLIDKAKPSLKEEAAPSKPLPKGTAPSKAKPKKRRRRIRKGKDPT